MRTRETENQYSPSLQCAKHLWLLISLPFQLALAHPILNHRVYTKHAYAAEEPAHTALHQASLHEDIFLGLCHLNMESGPVPG
jgi:hypothetical protein